MRVMRSPVLAVDGCPEVGVANGCLAGCCGSGSSGRSGDIPAGMFLDIFLHSESKGITDVAMPLIYNILI